MLWVAETLLHLDQILPLADQPHVANGSEDTADFQQWSEEQNFSSELEAYDLNAAQPPWLPSPAWMHLLRRGAVAEQGTTQNF